MSYYYSKPEFQITKGKYYLCAPYEVQDELKENGAIYDLEEKAWYAIGRKKTKLIKWFPTMNISPDLVPMTSHYQNVRSALSVEEWRALSKSTALASGKRCKACGGRGTQWPVECHEIWSYDDHSKIQKLDGLIPLCPRCHEVVHFGLANVRGRTEFALSHMGEVNSLNRSQCVNIVNEAIRKCRFRSRFQWTIDLSLLKALK